MGQIWGHRGLNFKSIPLSTCNISKYSSSYTESTNTQQKSLDLGINYSDENVSRSRSFWWKDQYSNYTSRCSLLYWSKSNVLIYICIIQFISKGLQCALTAITIVALWQLPYLGHGMCVIQFICILESQVVECSMEMSNEYPCNMSRWLGRNLYVGKCK